MYIHHTLEEKKEIIRLHESSAGMVDDGISAFIDDAVVLARCQLIEQLVGGGGLVGVGADACHHFRHTFEVTSDVQHV